MFHTLTVLTMSNTIHGSNQAIQCCNYFAITLVKKEHWIMKLLESVDILTDAHSLRLSFEKMHTH